MGCSDGRRLSDPRGSHGERDTTNHREIVELVGYVRGTPTQRAEKHVAHFVDREIDYTRVDVASPRCIADGACLGELGFTLAVEPLDYDRGVDKKRCHRRLSRSRRTKSAASNLPAVWNRRSERLTASSTAAGSCRASSRRAAAASRALRLMDLRRAASSSSLIRSSGNETITLDIPTLYPEVLPKIG
jgi:hypothetical protein